MNTIATTASKTGTWAKTLNGEDFKQPLKPPPPAILLQWQGWKTTATAGLIIFPLPSSAAHQHHPGTLKHVPDSCRGVGLGHWLSKRPPVMVMDSSAVNQGLAPALAALIAPPSVWSSCDFLYSCCKNDLSVMPTELNSNFWAQGKTQHDLLLNTCPAALLGFLPTSPSSICFQRLSQPQGLRT